MKEAKRKAKNEGGLYLFIMRKFRQVKLKARNYFVTQILGETKSTKVQVFIKSSSLLWEMKNRGQLYLLVEETQKH